MIKMLLLLVLSLVRGSPLRNAENSTEYVMMLNTKSPGTLPMLLNTNGGSKPVNFEFGENTEFTVEN